ncbi:uncharacterized protein LOC105833366 isoform X7 [Monomorium pharaonis]|uniref:uncharacterized protein LOC105833366 isoform X7 n=1 Tax=Monomorium pharaonis TaxID=307658 RepID=UPI00102E10AD|nr:uncharacterized protein LOC105833366 isoform X7 [Monomorium pharaonis]
MLLLSNYLQLCNKLQHDAEDCPKCIDAYIMLQEFCIFAVVLARLRERGTAAVPMNASCSLHGDGKGSNYKTGSKRMAYEVFLGGSCNPTTWRTDIAIPTLQSLGITYYNPQVSQWGPELIAQEYEAKQTARILLFVIDNQTRNSAGIIEAAQLAATRSESLVLVIYPYRQGQTILGETVSTQEYYDLMNGLLVLQYLMERQRIPIFESVSVALHCTSKVWMTLQSSTMCNNVSFSDLLNTVNKSEIYRTSIDGFSKDDDPTELRINFEQFCVLASELSWTRTKNNGVSCESEIPSVWNILCRKTSNFLRRVIVHPFNRFLDWTNSFVQEFEQRDIYIGVVNKDLFWLETSAAPLIESMRLSLYRPSLNEYNVRILPQELQKIKNSRLILLIVPQHSRGIAIMALAAHLIGLHSKLVLCVQILPEGSIVSDEQLTDQARKDYNRGRMYLSDYATREGVPVFQNIADALQHAIQLVQSPC